MLYIGAASLSERVYALLSLGPKQDVHFWPGAQQLLTTTTSTSPTLQAA